MFFVSLLDVLLATSYMPTKPNAQLYVILTALYARISKSYFEIFLQNKKGIFQNFLLTR